MLKKGIFVVLFSFILGTAFTQNKALIKRARKAPASVTKDIGKLTNYLIEGCTTDLEKVQNFYTWLIYHIQYDDAAYRKEKGRINRSNAEILQRGKAVCFGYSKLFVALCKQAEIPAVVVDGYPLQNGKVDLSAVTHSWNAVYLKDQWYLLDATWGGGNGRQEADYFFLTPPEQFITSHLPADPMWQILPNPISTADFQKGVTGINSSADTTYAFLDSIALWQVLPRPLQRLHTARNAYRYHPIIENKEQLGHTLLEYAEGLSNELDSLKNTGTPEEILQLQKDILDQYEEARQYIDLYTWQEENLAYNHFNYGVALSRQLPDAKKSKSILENMLIHFKKGETLLKKLPNNILYENALVQLADYITWTEKELAKQ